MKTQPLSEHAGSGAAQQLLMLAHAIRPADWIKNAFVAAPLFFSGQATEPDKVVLTGCVVLGFCTMASAVYLFNDIHDREHDRLHPKKRLRPIASGELSLHLAVMTAAALAVVGLIVVSFSTAVVVLLLVYGLLNVVYSLWAKHIVIVDVFSIGLGFVLRVVAGGVAIGVAPSSWLVLATFLLSLFLALGKRRHELLLMRMDATTHRPVLEEYSIKLVDELVSVITPVTLLTYILYTLDGGTVSRFHSNQLYLTSLFVVFGIFRYLYLIHQKDLGGSPTELVFRDLPLLLAIVGWIATFFLIVYFA